MIVNQKYSSLAPAPEPEKTQFPGDRSAISGLGYYKLTCGDTQTTGTRNRGPATAIDLDTTLGKVGHAGKGRDLAKAETRHHGTPIYGTDPAHPGFIVQELPDGTTRLVKFVNRLFMPW